MKKAFTIYFLFQLICTINYGQYVYHPFIQESTISVNNSKYYIHGDTIFNGICYMKIYYQQEAHPFQLDYNQSLYWGACRNDTLGKKVFFHVPQNVTVYDAMGHNLFVIEQDTDLLFYDFSLMVGDTIDCYFFEDQPNTVVKTSFTRVHEALIMSYHNGILVQDEDSIESFGNGKQIRKIIVKDANLQYPKEYVLWYEGAGSSSGFVSESPNYLSVSETPNRLLCYTDSDGDVFFTAFDNSDLDSADCFSLGYETGVDERVGNPVLTLFPNPTTGTIHLSSFSSTDKKCKIDLYNVLGELLFHGEYDNVPERMDFQDIDNGIYVFRLTISKDTFYQKIVKQ